MRKLLLLLAVFVSVAAKAGDFRTWSPTPPMGWNSWDCYGPTVTEEEVKANADYMAANLRQYGWEYVVVDIRWFVANTKSHGYNEKDPIYILDEYGRYQPAENKFPSSAGGKGFKSLADYIHAKGLKFGIHIMRGIPKQAVARHTLIKGTDGITADQVYSKEHECKWLHDNWTIDAAKDGAQQYYNSIMDLYAEWGVDFIKIDDLSAPYYHEAEIDMIRKAIDQTGRPIVLSTSPGETPIDHAAHVDSHANQWRMVNDVWDVWGDLTHLMKVASGWYPYIGEGTWPDCDMIPLGHLAIRGERGDDRMTRLTPAEQYSLMTFFTIFKSPLFYGGDLPTMDDFTLKLLTNKDVLAMHRDGCKVREVQNDGKSVVIRSENARTGEVYVAMFNLSDEKATVSAAAHEIAVNGRKRVMDMWSGKTMGKVGKSLKSKLEPHASVLYKLY